MRIVCSCRRLVRASGLSAQLHCENQYIPECERTQILIALLEGLAMCTLRHAAAALVAIALTALAEQTAPMTLAVSDLMSQGVSQNEAAVLSEQLRGALTRSGQLRLIERGQMQEILKEQGFQQSGCTSDACAVEIGQLLGVSTMVLGTVGVAGSYTVMSVRAIDVRTGSVLASESVQTKDGVNDLLETGVDKVASLLTAKLSAGGVPAAVADTVGSRRSPARAILIAGGAAVLVGAGVAAVVLLRAGGDDDGGSQDPIPNTRITLP
jgi:TolB-like protein